MEQVKITFNVERPELAGIDFAMNRVLHAAKLVARVEQRNSVGHIQQASRSALMEAIRNVEELHMDTFRILKVCFMLLEAYGETYAADRVRTYYADHLGAKFNQATREPHKLKYTRMYNAVMEWGKNVY